MQITTKSYYFLFMFLPPFMLTSNSFFVYQIISQFFGLRMVWEIWNSLLESYQGKIIPDNARHLGQVGVVRLSLRALGWVWGLLCGMGACSEDALAT